GCATATAEQAAAAARMPRTVMALLVGAALAMSGTTLQGITRNPLADPGIFGVLSGASLAVVTGIAFFGLSRPVPTMIAAMVGSLAAAVFVYFVGSLGRGGATPLKLALSGAATAAAASSLVSANFAAARRCHGSIPLLANWFRRRCRVAHSGFIATFPSRWFACRFRLRTRA